MGLRPESIANMILRLALILAAVAPAGCGAAAGLQAQEASGRSARKPAGGSSASTTATTTSSGPASHYIAAGARRDAGGDEWILLRSSLQISRDAGAHWRRLPLPSELRPPTKAYPITDVAVLKGRTVAVAESTRIVGIDIYTLLRGSRRWRRIAVRTGVYGGGAEIVDENGALLGVMVRKVTSSNYSQGVWVAKGPDGTGWQVRELPVAGEITAAHGLWLVGGVLGQDVYHSSDGGVRWQRVHVPASIGRRGGPSYRRVEVDGSRLVLVAGSGPRMQVLLKRPGSRWRVAKVRGAGDAVLRLGSTYSPGAAPDVSVAGGMLWIQGFTRMARIDLTTGRLAVVTEKGLPQHGVGDSSLHALGADTAWASYWIERCEKVKSDCHQTKGIVVTKDGGASWTPASYHLVE